jgi:hypothetical protein
MVDRIDEELERISRLGESPKTIYVGSGLHLDLETEQNSLWGGDLASVQRQTPTEEVKEYKGIPVVLKEGVAFDYLEIET